jgi:hypothetical protein
MNWLFRYTWWSMDFDQGVRSAGHIFRRDVPQRLAEASVKEECRRG